MEKFKVLRQHHGDKPYAEGDTREADERDVAHLVANGVLEPMKAKAEPAAKNKAEPAVQNKAKADK
ncbi:MAG: hypothetical protein FJX25_02580 [Alphaproteobacteria bacterium]|nr:hypothetical protein [Alphaproteobacteria bacterium]